jgi:hypothetical protein
VKASRHKDLVPVKSLLEMATSHSQWSQTPGYLLASLGRSYITVLKMSPPLNQADRAVHCRRQEPTGIIQIMIQLNFKPRNNPEENRTLNFPGAVNALFRCY